MRPPIRRHWVPVAIGGAAGALYAWFGSGAGSAPSETAAPTAELHSAVPAATSSAPMAVRPAAPPPIAAPVPAAPSATPSASAPATSAAPSAAPAPIFDLSAPESAEALLATQVRCNAKSPEDCERAAPPLERGSFAPPDPARARALRRMALTLYVKQCESKRASACARLAEMYTVGELVQPSERSASALRARVRELCANGSVDPACR